MNRLLQKLDIIREQIGSDRVYDVISDVFQGVNLEDILKSTLQGEVNSFNKAIDNDFTSENVKDKIKAQKEKLACKRIDFESAKKLMDDSLEKRLIPIYLERFFKKSFISLGGVIKIENDFIHLKQIPKKIKEHLKEQFNIGYDITKMMFTFHKEVFLDKKKTGKYERLYYLNPGNPIYDATVELVLSEYKEEVLKGTILVSPEEKDPYFAYFVRSQITDKTKKENITDEKLALVCGKNDELDITSPAKLIDLVPPVEYAKKIDIPEPVSEEQIVRWSFVNITNPQFEEVKVKVKEDIELRKEYLDQGISSMILNHTLELTDLREKLLLGNDKVQDKVEKLEQKIIELEERKEKRMSELDQRMQLNRKSPKVIGSAYVVPLSQVEYNSHYGMSRDDEVEQIAMDIAMKYEKEEGWLCEDVSSKNLGFDLKSVDPELIKRYIEVKGRAAEGPVMISENEMNRLKQLGKTAWLYIVSNCKSNPTLHRVNDPGNNLNCKELSKGIQYLVPLQEWKSKSKN